MPELDRYGLPKPSALSRRGARIVSRNRVSAELRVAEADTESDVANAKIENLTRATTTAMGAILHVNQAQEMIERIAPGASGRLAHLADQHALGVAQLVDDLRQELRRG